MKGKEHFAAAMHDISGYAAADFIGDAGFDTLAESVPGYSAKRYQPVALRMYIENGSPVFTLFAYDREKQRPAVMPEDRMPVKKFKFRMPMEDFLRQLRAFDCTLMIRGFNVANLWIENR